jgi:hypothetical protein
MEHTVKSELAEEMEVLGKKPVPVKPQIPNGPNWY